MKLLEVKIPSSRKTITIEFTEDEIKSILLDLDSESKQHRPKTVIFKEISNEFLDNIKRQEEIDKIELYKK